MQHPTIIEIYQIMKKSTHTHTDKKDDGQIKKTPKRVADSTLPWYGAMVGIHDSAWPFKVNPSRNSAYRTEKLTKNTSKNKTLTSAAKKVLLMLWLMMNVVKEAVFAPRRLKKS